MVADLTDLPPAACLAAAQEVGRRLVREAVWHRDRCTWLGDDVEDDGTVVHRSLAGDLYGGTSGVGWFLANLAAATGDEDAAEAAAGALRHALRRVRESGDCGLYTGRAGAALAAVAGGHALGDGALLASGADLAGDVARTATAPAAAAELDLIGGLAGTALALVELASALDDDALLGAAVVLGERLLAARRPTSSGSTWTAPDAPQPLLCGLGHGASGLALAFLELERAVGDGRFGEAAAGSLRYERAWFSRERGNWPDLRELDWSRLDAGAQPPYLVYWCHGAAGIGLVRLHAFRRRGDETALAEAAAAIDTATSTMLRVVASPRPAGRIGPDLSLCHGVGSVAELHVTAAEVTGDSEHLAHARRLVQLALVGREAVARAGEANGSGGGLRLPAELPCGVPGGGETPGLLLGLAGIGATLLRLCDPALLPSPLLVAGWGRAAPAEPDGSEGRDRGVAPDLEHAGVPLQLGDHGLA